MKPLPMRGTVCAYHGKSEGYYRSTACRNVCIHCGKQNGIQLSYGTGAGKNVSLLCTSGQPRYAALKLISLIVQSGIPIYYSGDLDPDGIGIADRLWQRFGNRINSLECHQRITGTVFQKKYLERMAEKSWNTFGTRY